jgi:hypothetical protein
VGVAILCAIRSWDLVEVLFQDCDKCFYVALFRDEEKGAKYARLP